MTLLDRLFGRDDSPPNDRLRMIRWHGRLYLRAEDVKAVAEERPDATLKDFMDVVSEAWL